MRRRIRVRRHLRQNQDNYGRHQVREHERQADGGIKGNFLRRFRNRDSSGRSMEQQELEFFSNQEFPIKWENLTDEEKTIAQRLDQKGHVDITGIWDEPMYVRRKTRLSRSLMRDSRQLRSSHTRMNPINKLE